MHHKAASCLAAANLIVLFPPALSLSCIQAYSAAAAAAASEPAPTAVTASEAAEAEAAAATRAAEAAAATGAEASAVDAAAEGAASATCTVSTVQPAGRTSLALTACVRHVAAASKQQTLVRSSSAVTDACPDAIAAATPAVAATSPLRPTPPDMRLAPKGSHPPQSMPRGSAQNRLRLSSEMTKVSPPGDLRLSGSPSKAWALKDLNPGTTSRGAAEQDSHTTGSMHSTPVQQDTPTSASVSTAPVQNKSGCMSRGDPQQSRLSRVVLNSKRVSAASAPPGKAVQSAQQAVSGDAKHAHSPTEKHKKTQAGGLELEENQQQGRRQGQGLGQQQQQDQIQQQEASEPQEHQQGRQDEPVHEDSEHPQGQQSMHSHGQTQGLHLGQGQEQQQQHSQQGQQQRQQQGPRGLGADLQFTLQLKHEQATQDKGQADPHYAACSARNIISMLLPKDWVQRVWAFEVLLSGMCMRAMAMRVTYALSEDTFCHRNLLHPSVAPLVAPSTISGSVTIPD